MTNTPQSDRRDDIPTFKEDIPYIPRNSDLEMSRRISAGHYCCLLGSPKSGKTRALCKIKDEVSLRDDWRCEYVSLKATNLVNARNAFNWYFELIKNIGRPFNIDTRHTFNSRKRDSYIQSDSLTTHDILYDFINELLLEQVTSLKIVILIDDIEKIDEFARDENERGHYLNEFSRGFFRIINRCYNEALREGETDEYRFRRIQFVFSGNILAERLEVFSESTDTNHFRISTIEPVELGSFSIETIEENEELHRLLKQKADASTRELRFVFSKMQDNSALVIIAISILSDNPHSELSEIMPKIERACDTYLGSYKSEDNSVEAETIEIEESADMESVETSPSHQNSTDKVSNNKASEDFLSTETTSTTKIEANLDIADSRSPSSNGLGRKFLLPLIFLIVTLVSGTLVNVFANIVSEEEQWRYWIIPQSAWQRLMLIGLIGLIAIIFLAVEIQLGLLVTDAIYYNRIRNKIEATWSCILRKLSSAHRKMGELGREFLSHPLRKLSAYVLLGCLTVFFVVRAHPPNTRVRALVLPHRSEAYFSTESQKILEDADSRLNQLELLQRALINASESNSFQKKKGEIPIIRRSVKQSMPILALQHVYDQISESQNFEVDEAESFGIFDVSEGSDDEGNDIAAVVGSDADRIVILRRNGHLIDSFDADQNKLKDIKVTNSGRFVITAGLETIKVWDSESRNIEKSYKEIAWEEGTQQVIQAIQLSKDEQLLVGISDKGDLKAWQIDPTKLEVKKEIFPSAWNIIKYDSTSAIPNIRVQASKNCLAVSASVENNVEDRLKVIRLKDIENGTESSYSLLGEALGKFKDFLPAAIDIDKQDRFIVVAGEKRNEGRSVEPEIKIIPLHTQTGKICEPHSPQAVPNIQWIGNSNAGPIVDARLSRNSERLFVMYKDGFFKVYDSTQQL